MEVAGTGGGLFFRRVDSEDDYTVEAYLRWNSGGSESGSTHVTEALSAYYKIALCRSPCWSVGGH